MPRPLTVISLSNAILLSAPCSAIEIWGIIVIHCTSNYGNIIENSKADLILEGNYGEDSTTFYTRSVGIVPTQPALYV